MASFIMQAQEPVYVHMSEEEGLPDRTVYRIVEDQDGLLWLATNFGLYSYNGDKFIHHSHEKQVRSSVFGLEFDKKGRLWYTNMGAELYYIEKGKPHAFINLKKEIGEALLDYKIIENKIVATHNNVLYTIDIKTKKINKKRLSDISVPTTISHRFKGKDYFFLEDTLFEITKDTFIVKSKTDKPVAQTRIMSLFNDKKKLYVKLLIDNKNIFYEVKDSNKTVPVETFNTLSQISINHSKLLEDSYWFFTVNGAYQYSYIEEELVLKNHYLEGVNVTDLVIDNNGYHIFSTLNNGLYIIPETSVKVYRHESFNEGVISNFRVINDSVINYISSNNEIHSINFSAKTHITKRIDRFRNQLIYFDPFISKGLFYNNTELEIFNPLSLKTIDKIPRQLTPKKIVRLNDSLYITTTPNKTSIRGNDFKELKYFNGRSEQVTVTKSGHYYIGTAKGLKWGTGINNPEKIYSGKKGLKVHHIVSEENSDRVWVNRYNWGLYHIENGKILKTIYAAQGLLEKNFRAMDLHGENLWIATSKGIQRYNYITETFTNFGLRDGITQSRILDLQVTDSFVWYHTSTGIYQFPIDKKEKEDIIPKVYFSNIKIGNVAQNIKTDYTVGYDANSLDVDFMINGFKMLEQYQFEYTIEGLNKKWTTLEVGKHDLNFNSLPSGKYTFKVRAKSLLRGDYTTPVQFNLNITLPFWKRWWFSSLLALLVIICTIIFFKIKAKRKEEQRKKELEQIDIERQLVTLKLENLRSQMNPHFIFNALNSIQEYIVLNQKKMAGDYLGKFADLMRTYLNHSTKGTISLEEEIDCLEMYLELEKLRFEEKLQYTIKTIAIDSSSISIPTMLVQPYVENALKHGLLHRKDNRKLEVNFHLNIKTKTVTCSIIDNGVGRSKSEELKARSHKKHKSFATKATQDRLDLLNYGKEKKVGITITDLFEKEIAIGTRVDIIIPYENI